MTEVYRIKICFYDLFFRKGMLKPAGIIHFEQLTLYASHALRIRKIYVTGQLLSYGACAANLSVACQR